MNDLEIVPLTDEEFETQLRLEADIRNDSRRLGDCIYIAHWVHQLALEDPQAVPASIYDLACRALDEPSLAHGERP